MMELDPNNKVEQIESITEQELLDEIQKFTATLAEIASGYDDSSTPFLLEEQQTAYSHFIDKLILIKNRFKYVFKTVSGSYYFVLDNGKSFRIRNDQENGYVMQPIADEVYFLNGNKSLKQPEVGTAPLEIFENFDGRSGIHKGHVISEIIK